MHIYSSDFPDTWNEYTGIRGLPFIYEGSNISSEMLHLYFEDIYQINQRRTEPLFSYIKQTCVVAKHSILHRWIKENINLIGLLPIRKIDTHITKWEEVNCLERTNFGVLSLTYFLCYTRQDMRIYIKLLRRKDIVKMVKFPKWLRDLILSREVLFEEDAVAFLEAVKYDTLFVPMLIELTDGIVINYTRSREWIPSFGENILKSRDTMKLLSESKNYDSGGPKVIPHIWYNICADKGMDYLYIARDLYRSPRKTNPYGDEESAVESDIINEVEKVV